MTALSPEERVAPLRGAIDDISRQFPQLRLLTPAGVLRVPVVTNPLTLLRLEVPEDFLHLQSIRLVTADGSDASVGARVTASSWYGAYGEKFDQSRLFDWDHPTGTTVHTNKDGPSWLEVRFARPVRLVEVLLRNVNNSFAWRARQLRAVGRTRWRRHVLFDFEDLHREVGATVAAQAARDLDAADPQVQALVPVLVDTLRAAYPVARKALNAANLDAGLVKAFRAVVNAELLPSRELLWTIHGPCRAFQFWTAPQQVAYVEFAVAVVEALRKVTPHVSFGFGAALSIVRDKALIPHDDDLDIIVAFEPEEAATLADGLALVTRSLEESGFSVRGRFPTHRQIGRNNRGKHVDVFVGMFEGEAVSWYPGARGGLSRTMMYPTTTAPLLGIECAIPAHAEDYLAALYGDDWRTPDPNFTHRKDRASYADISGAPKNARATATKA